MTMIAFCTDVMQIPTCLLGSLNNRFHLNPWFMMCSKHLMVKRKPRSDKNIRHADPAMHQKIKRILKETPNLSTRTVARKIGKSPDFVQKSKQNLGLKSNKVKNVPNRDDQQNLTAK